MWYYNTGIRITKMKKTDNTKCWQGCRATWDFHPLLEKVNKKVVNSSITTFEIQLVVPTKLKYVHMLGSSNSIPRNILNRNVHISSQRDMH